MYFSTIRYQIITRTQLSYSWPANLQKQSMNLRSDASPVKSTDYLIATIPRTDAADYSDFVDIIANQFPFMPREEIIVQTRCLYICEGSYVEIIPRYWRGISTSVDNVRVILPEDYQNPS
ncbi:hypothetical protein ARMSODRAFT_981522 [Armillaria solidipes]|uniref:Uncharacterized protein n=1 Tax=Armillaria solidipes TaxID=1076256 RepID=A0A2H3B9V7_9AGAR|nr:hypothetical protein ARMSODRAFT_981522 [Armillaria solidipes]